MLEHVESKVIVDYLNNLVDRADSPGREDDWAQVYHELRAFDEVIIDVKTHLLAKGAAAALTEQIEQEFQCLLTTVKESICLPPPTPEAALGLYPPARVAQISVRLQAGDLARMITMAERAQDERNGTAPGDGKTANRTKGKRWIRVQQDAEKIVKAKDGRFPGIRPLCSQLRCHHATLNTAINNSAYLKARKAEYDRKTAAAIAGDSQESAMQDLIADSNHDNEADPSPVRARMRTPS